MVEPWGMINSISALRDVTQRFDQAALRTVAAARGLAEATPDSPDLANSMVDLISSEKAVKAVMAAVKTSNAMDSAVLDIVA